MNLLLDTHIWVWSVLEPSRLGRHVRQELADPAHELWLSPISVWETLLLISKRRIHVYRSVPDWVQDAKANFKEAPLTHQIVLAAHELRLAHRDPADRFLAATAKVLKLTLVTADEHLLGLGPDIATLANR